MIHVSNKKSVAIKTNNVLPSHAQPVSDLYVRINDET
jgi:hypothetical protein